MNFLLNRFNVIQDLIASKNNEIHKSQLPICYNYDLQGQIQMIEIDLEIGHLIKQKPPEVANKTMHEELSNRYTNHFRIYADGSKVTRIKHENTPKIGGAMYD